MTYINDKPLFIAFLLLCSFLLLFSSFAIEGSQNNSSWEIGEEMPTPRTDLTSAIIDNKIYTIGGANYQEEGQMDVVEVYNPDENEWIKTSPLPLSLDHTSAVAYDGKIFVIGGFLAGKETTNKVLIYDPIEDEWSEIEPLPSPRAGLTAEIINGTIYAIGGLDEDHHPVNTNEAYDIATDTWSAKAPLPGPPKHHTASAEVDGKIYILGGRTAGNGKPSDINDSLTNFDDNLQYDPATNSWKALEPMPIRRSGFTASPLDGQIFVFGGQGLEGPIDNAERYDPTTNKWHIEQDVPTKRTSATSVPFDGKIYVMGGQTNDLEALNTNEIFYPRTRN
jgi:N-acetylneuraminic acid mutarotase